MQLLHHPDGLCFSSSLGSLLFRSATGSAAVSLRMDASWDGGGATLLDESYYPSSAGDIEIGDLTGLLEVYAREHLVLRVVCTCTEEGGGSATAVFDVAYCCCDVGLSYADFAAVHFLTLLDGVKPTSAGRTELLHVHYERPHEEEEDTICNECTVTALLSGPPLSMVSASLPFGSGSVLRNGYTYAKLDVSPDVVAAALGVGVENLVHYTIRCDNREQGYAVGPGGERAGHTNSAVTGLSFVNSFGYRETFYCIGVRKVGSTFERKSVRVDGNLRNYLVREERTFTVSTGALSDAMCALAADLLRSRCVHLLNADGSDGREVVITGSKSEASNADDALTSFELTFTYAHRVQGVMDRVTVGGRIHGDTFNGTFN